MPNAQCLCTTGPSRKLRAEVFVAVVVLVSFEAVSQLVHMSHDHMVHYHVASHRLDATDATMMVDIACMDLHVYSLNVSLVPHVPMTTYT